MEPIVDPPLGAESSYEIRIYGCLPLTRRCDGAALVVGDAWGGGSRTIDVPGWIGRVGRDLTHPAISDTE
jgi:hypothetical protein